MNSFDIFERCELKKMTVISEESWERLFGAVKEQFEISNLLPEQENLLREFLFGKNIFVNLPTGYAKSLIFQCLPVAADALFERPRGSSVIVVISPLRALMEDQVRQLNDIGIQRLLSQTKRTRSSCNRS